MPFVQWRSKLTLSRVVLVLVVDMNKGTLNIGKTFQFTLEILADVVGYFKWRVLVHDDVHLNVVLLSSMVGSALHDSLSIPKSLPKQILGAVYLPSQPWRFASRA